jgi:NADPH-dependent 2,4-dienoyl-CoA reductase/sulfur reductase-like enzyme
MTNKNYIPNLPETDKKRIVIIGGGFAGLKFVRKSLCQHYRWYC